MDRPPEYPLAQRIDALALGGEDLNDHERVASRPHRAAAGEKVDLRGNDRFLPQFRDAALALPSILNRRELVPRYFYWLEYEVISNLPVTK